LLLVAIIGQPAPGWSDAGTLDDFAVSRVVAVSGKRPVVTIDVGGETGDRFVILRDGVPVAVGDIILVTPRESGGRLVWTGQPPQAGDTAIVLGQRILREPSRHLLPHTTLQTAITALNPGRSFAWIPIGRSVSVQTGDRFLVWRARLPIAQAEAALTDDRTALIALTPIVKDLRPSQGDPVTLSPSPYERTTRRLTATVLSATQHNDGQMLVLGTGRPTRFRPDDRLDIYRADAYVGYAAVTRSDSLLVEAQTVTPFGAEPVAVGDRAVRRAGRSSTARIFRIENNVCLITAGQRDGVRFDETGYLAGLPHVGLTVENVLEEHSVVRVSTLPSASSESTSPALWDEVTLGGEPPGGTTVMGRTPAEMPVDWLATVARIDAGPDVGTGQLVRCASSPPAAAMIIHVDRHHAVLYCPEPWRAGSIANVEVVVPEPNRRVGAP
jgi:hypothetical protein